MGITCNNYITTNSYISDVRANSMASPSSNANIVFHNDVEINGSVYSRGRLDMGATVFATFRLASNQPLIANGELYPSSNMLIMDVPRTNMADMDTIMSSPSYNIYNPATGEITIPVNGLYYLQIQGVFQNTPVSLSTHRNGVYFYFRNHTYPNTRVAASIVNSTVVCTSQLVYLLEGDRILPVFYTNDDNATLIATGNETYISFALISTTLLTNRNHYHRQ